jgi:dienelactone hydrolase
MKRFALVTSAAMMFAFGLSAGVEQKDVDIKAPDGVNLKGTYFSPDRSGPAILLLHQCNMDRHAWDGLAKDLAGAGFHVLTVAYRCYGDSGGQRYKDEAQQRALTQEKWPGDVDAAYAYLIGRKGVDKSRLAAGGASCGVTQSSNLATRRHEIKALVWLSGAASDEAKAYIGSIRGLFVFGAASEGDTDAAKAIRAAVETSKNPQSLLKIYSGSEHGVPMFGKNPDLEPLIVSWLKARFTVRP